MPHPSTRPRCMRLLVAVALAVLAPLGAAAFKCVANESARSLQLSQAAAARPECAPYATNDTDGFPDISFSCESPSCTSVMQELAEQLPNCENSNDVNLKKNLESTLYGYCSLCKPSMVATFWQTVGQNEACAPYMSANGSAFVWPCAATACTAAVKAATSSMFSCKLVLNDPTKYSPIADVVQTCSNATASTPPASTTSAPSTSGTSVAGKMLSPTWLFLLLAYAFAAAL